MKVETGLTAPGPGYLSSPGGKPPFINPYRKETDQTIEAIDRPGVAGPVSSSRPFHPKAHQSPSIPKPTNIPPITIYKSPLKRGSVVRSQGHRQRSAGGATRRERRL